MNVDVISDLRKTSINEKNLHNTLQKTTLKSKRNLNYDQEKKDERDCLPKKEWEINLYHEANTLWDYGVTDAGCSDCTDSLSEINTRWEVQCEVGPSHTGTETAGSLSPFSPRSFNVTKPVAALLTSDNRWTNGFCHLTPAPPPPSPAPFPCYLTARRKARHTCTNSLWSTITPLVLWTRNNHRPCNHDFLAGS